MVYLPRRQRRRGTVGPVLGADGTTPSSGRQGKTGESVVGQSWGKYYEAASRGFLFAACDQGVGVVVQVTITTVATFSLYNPAGSQKRISIKKLAISYFNGTMPAGSFYHGFLAPGNTLPSGGTLLSSNCTDIGNQSATGGIGIARTGATVVAATALYPFASSFPELASTANGFQVVNEDVDGAIVLEPGAQYQLLGVFGGAGSSPKVSVGCVWGEPPIVASNG